MLARFLSSFLALSIFCAIATAQISGSAFVIDRYGAHVPGNSFERLDAVFFSAGRGANCAGTSLADGDYYYQITDPAGGVLLSGDPIVERKVRVSGGVVVQYLGSNHHTSPKGPCGSLYLQLYPFQPTPFPIGEYKIWLTRVQDYDPLLTNLFGFDPARSKSDNFRVQAKGPQAILRGHKFFDHNRGGTWNPQVDPLEVPIGGWRVELYKSNVLDGVTFTDQDGWYIFIRDRDAGAYLVREVAPGGFVNDATPGAKWLATTPRTGTVAATAEYVAAPEFGNVVYELSVGAGRPVDFWANENQNDDDNCYPGGGCERLQMCDPTWRAALTAFNGLPVKLRRSTSLAIEQISVFVPPPTPLGFQPAFEEWESFANYPPNDHAGFLLSRQVAAALLSKSCGFMQGSIYIDRFQDGVLVSLDDMIIGVIALLSDPHAAQTGPTTVYQDLRHMMQMCTNEFGRINETGEPTAPQVVYRAAPIPPRIAVPYN